MSSGGLDCQSFLIQFCELHCLLHSADHSDTVHMNELPLSKVCSGAFSGLIQHMSQVQRAHWNWEGLQCFWMRDDSSDITKGMCAVDGRHRGMQGEARTIGYIFVCCLHLLGAISRQQPTTIRCLRGRERGTESVKEECKWGEKVNGKDCNCKRKWGNMKIWEEDSSGSQSNILTCVNDVKREHQAHLNLLMRTVQRS